jgi:hypothetical protein
MTVQSIAAGIGGGANVQAASPQLLALFEEVIE